MRAIFEPRDPQLRFMPMGDTTAAYWYFWFARLVSLLGYTLHVRGTISPEQLTAGAAQAVRVLAMTTSVIIGILIILQNKREVRHALSWRSRAGKEDPFCRNRSLSLGRTGHLIAIFYLVALLVVWLTNPEEALPFMLGATVQSIIGDRRRHPHHLLHLALH